MELFHLPHKFELRNGSHPFEAHLIVEPCYQGYGTTLGNALRRVLLSSLPGAAVVAVKIRGVDHEFSAIPHVKEDVIQIILNLKKLRLRVFSSETVRLELKATGERVITAGDISPSSDVEIANKDLVLATLTDKAADLEMEIFVRAGRGYVPIEERTKENLEIGTIAIDAIFTPIRSVGYRVEDVRVGQITNFDRLDLAIETDGTISPKDALVQSIDILVNHFSAIKGHLDGSATVDEKNEKEETESVDAQPKE